MILISRNVWQTMALMPLAVTACTIQNDLSKSPQPTTLNSKLAAENPSVQSFYKVCLSENSSEDKRYDLATSQGFTQLSKSQLKTFGLSSVRKKITEVPGGGAPVSETQQLLVLDDEIKTILSLETYKEQDKLLNSSCKFYSKTENYLKLCEVLGRVIGRAPDSNKKYEASKAHFINWHISLHGKQARVSCESPGSVRLPDFKGGILSATYAG